MIIDSQFEIFGLEFLKRKQVISFGVNYIFDPKLI